MSFSDQFMQVFLLIVVLLAAYLGVNLWTKHSGGIRLPGMGGEAGKAEGHGSATDEAEAHLAGTMRSKGGSRSSAAERHGDRFNLTGKDAEAAAKVLKRMLKQDQELKKK